MSQSPCHAPGASLPASPGFHPFPTVDVLLSRSCAQLIILRDMLGGIGITRLDAAELRDLESNIFYLLEGVIEQLDVLACHIPPEIGDSVASHPRSDDYRSAAVS